jgi:hypothetical protein
MNHTSKIENSGKVHFNSESHHINLPSKSNFTDVQFDLLVRGNSQITEIKSEKIFTNFKDIYDIYTKKKEDGE